MREKGHWSPWAEHRSHHLGEGAPWYWFGWAGSWPYGCGRGRRPGAGPGWTHLGAALHVERGKPYTKHTSPVCKQTNDLLSVTQHTARLLDA